MPIIGLFAGALFGGSSLVAISAYFIGVAAIVISGVILKKDPGLRGRTGSLCDGAAAYHMPSARNVLHATWERGWALSSGPAP